SIIYEKKGNKQSHELKGSCSGPILHCSWRGKSWMMQLLDLDHVTDLVIPRVSY
ncbi:hypothetical protein MKX03_030826, partial [Papaver bracteatum]